MNDAVTTWAVIVTAAVVTNLLRAGPVLLFRRGARTTGGLFRFLEYSSYVIIGGLISGSVVSRKVLLAPSPAAVAESVIALLVVGSSFAFAVRIRQPLVCLVAGLGLFVVLNVLWRLL